MNETKKAAEQRPRDAVALLRADHETVSALFEQFEKTRSPVKKQLIAAEVCKELTVHAALEEEIFYPAAKLALKDTEMVPEALVEHDGVKKLIAEIEGSKAEGEMFDARVKVLSELVKHHVKEEQNELFPAVKKTSMDLKELGARLVARKAEMLEEAGVNA